MTPTQTLDIAAVTKAANTRPDTEGENAVEYEKGSVKKLGSRVTKKQTGVVAEVITTAQRKALVGTDELRAGLQGYADTGEREYLTTEQSEVLSALVKASRERAENESQARRFWPRKVAAMVINL